MLVQQLMLQEMQYWLDLLMSAHKQMCRLMVFELEQALEKSQQVHRWMQKELGSEQQ